MRTRNLVAGIVLLLLIMAAVGLGQLAQSGGAGTSTTLQAGSALVGKVGLDQTTPGTTNAVALSTLGSTAVATGTGAATAGTLRVAVATDSSFSIANTGFALNAGSNLIGFVKQRPVGCTAAGTSDVVHEIVGVATGAGTSMSSVTGCIEECFVNNTTNSAVTLRIATKDGTPIVWLGGNADFSIPPNSTNGCGGNGGLQLAGITMNNGITAIAGTASALNLHLVTRE